MTVTWQWYHVLTWTIGLLEIGVLFGVPFGYWLARLPIRERDEPRHAASDEAPPPAEQPAP